MEGVESEDISQTLFQIGKTRRKEEYDLGLMRNKGEFVKVFSPSQAPKELIFPKYFLQVPSRAPRDQFVCLEVPTIK